MCKISKRSDTWEKTWWVNTCNNFHKKNNLKISAKWQPFSLVAGDLRRHRARYDVIVMANRWVSARKTWIQCVTMSFLHKPIDLPLQWRHNERDGVSNHRRLGCLLNHLFRRRLKKTSKLRVTGLYEGNSPVTGEFPTQRASDAEMFPFDYVIMPFFFNRPHWPWRGVGDWLPSSWKTGVHVYLA